MTSIWHFRVALVGLLLGVAGPSARAGSLSFTVNATADHEYGHQLAIPAGFGDGEFTFEIWLRPDDSFPVGPTPPDTPQQLINWTDTDNEPYSSGGWWFAGNFLLDGHNNAAFQDGTFSLQFYGGGRLRWLFGDGAFAGPGGHWSIGAYPAGDTDSLLDGDWHQVTLVRRWSGVSDADLELWIDGALVDVATSPVRTDMRTWWDGWSGFPGGQEGWFWGAEKQAAIGVLSQYEDYKGLVDEIRLWSHAKSASAIMTGYADPVSGSEPGLVGWFAMSERGGPAACDELSAGDCIDLINADAMVWSAEDAPIGAGEPIPAADGWAFVVLMLAMLTAGTVVVGRGWNQARCRGDG